MSMVGSGFTRRNDVGLSNATWVIGSSLVSSVEFSTVLYRTGEDFRFYVTVCFVPSNQVEPSDGSSVLLAN